MHSLIRRSALSAPAGLNDNSLNRSLPLNRYVAFISIAALGCAADLLSKHWIFAWRGFPRENNEWWLWEPYVGIETSLNTGALFGLGSGWGAFFAVLSIAAGVAIPVWLFCFRAATSLWLTAALSCVMGGLLGNLYDRLGFWIEPGTPHGWKSAVRDWILFRYGQFTWPNFNIADSLLVCGAGMLLWQAFREKPVQKCAP